MGSRNDKSAGSNCDSAAALVHVWSPLAADLCHLSPPDGGAVNDDPRTLPRWCANNGHPKLLVRLIGDYRYQLTFRTGSTNDGRKAAESLDHVDYSMSLPSTRQILDSEFENNASVANDSGYTFINIRN